MARNSVVHLEDIELLDDMSTCRSKYWKNKEDYIGMWYNELFLKDIIITKQRIVFGVCDCSCGESNIVTGINHLLNGSTKSCVNCAIKTTGEKRTKYLDDKYIDMVFGDLRVLSVYKGDLDGHKGVIWKMKCQLCGKVKDFRAASVIKSSTVSCGCKGHNRNNKYKDKSLIGTLINNIKVLDITEDLTIDTGTIWVCECPFCGNKFKGVARHIVAGHKSSCGCMEKSAGVHTIASELSKLGFKYREEYTYDDCRSNLGYLLRYDFAVLDAYDSVVFLIEYDGMQHFSADNQFGDFEVREENFKRIVENDNIKNDYCRVNNIPLLRIKYSRNKDDIINELYNFISLIKKGGFK